LGPRERLGRALADFFIVARPGYDEAKELLGADDALRGV
jgi:hypothetical protein